MHDIEKLEATLWEAADNLRANSHKSSSEYCMPVLGVIFLRHATNRYAACREIARDQVSSSAARLPDPARRCCLRFSRWAAFRSPVSQRIFSTISITWELGARQLDFRLLYRNREAPTQNPFARLIAITQRGNPSASPSAPAPAASRVSGSLHPVTHLAKKAPQMRHRIPPHRGN